jgi:uncharacterized repeat protein (TIGR01451 family)
MRRSSSFARPRAILMVLATAVSIALLAGVAAADTATTDFESFNLGSVNGQQGWKSATSGIDSPNGQFDQEVVKTGGTIPTFGQQAFRISNAYTSGIFVGQTYSGPATDAGEDLPNTEFIAQFSFITTTPEYQPGLRLSINADSGVGERMSYISLTDTQAGVAVAVQDTPDADRPQDFAVHPIGVPLEHGVRHTIKFWIKFVPGPDNDLMRVSIDGNDSGECFTTWENFVRASVGHLSPVNSLQFRTAGPAAPAVAGGGYLFDNVKITTAPSAGPPGCDFAIDKQADAPTANAGGRAGYRITVRNRGALSARNVRVCDHVPRRMTFLSADRKLFRLGHSRCLLIPRLAAGQRVSFHLMLHVNANAPQGTEANIADVTPGVEPPGSPPPPAATDVPGPVLPPAAAAARRAKRARVIVKVLARRAAGRGRLPRFTG